MIARWRGRPVLTPTIALRDCQWCQDTELRSDDIVVVRGAYRRVVGGGQIFHLIWRRPASTGARLGWSHPLHPAVLACRERLDAAGVQYIHDEGLGCLR